MREGGRSLTVWVPHWASFCNLHDWNQELTELCALLGTQQLTEDTYNEVIVFFCSTWVSELYNLEKMFCWRQSTCSTLGWHNGSHFPLQFALFDQLWCNSFLLFSLLNVALPASIIRSATNKQHNVTFLVVRVWRDYVACGQSVHFRRNVCVREGPNAQVRLLLPQLARSHLLTPG